METALISGGGAYIYFTVGRFEALQKDYDIVIGTSAGALIAPLIALGYTEKAVEAVKKISPSSIFSVNPFNKDGKIKVFNALKRLIMGKRTLGENENLPKLIKKFYTELDHLALSCSTKKVYVTVANTNKADFCGEIICLNECFYEDAVKYMWASASVPVVCSFVKIGKYEYVDGGTTLNVPADFAVSLGAKNIDVFMHDTEPTNEIKGNVTSIFHTLGRILKWQRQKVQFDQLNSVDTSKVKMNVYWLPYKPKNHALLFDKDIMQEYYNAGYNQIKS